VLFRSLVPGQTDEYIVIVAHLDGYFDSANDNGAGLASMLALAKHYIDPNTPKPKRNLLFVGTAGHHEFSDGVESFIERHADILEKSVLVFNVEHPSSAGAYYRGPLKFYRGVVPGQLSTTTTESTRSLTVSNYNKLIISFYRDAIDRYGLVIDSNVQRSPPTGDAYGFFKAGNTVVQILDANHWYHSTGDTLETMYPSGLARATRLYAYVLDRIDATSREQLE
jgi:Zn-dependent M28 family amino/carboxypeptidase